MDGWIGLQELAILEPYEGFDVTSGEVYTTLTVLKRGAGTAVDVVCRGATAAAFALRPEARIVSGRTLLPGRNEIIVGAAAARQYAGLDVGDSVQARTATLEVVGHFAEGAVAESEIWMDRAISQSVFRRTTTVSVARVTLAPDVDVKALNQRLAADPRLTGTLIPEQEFFAAQSASRAALIDAFAYLIAGIMALGSVFGALATMFTAVSRRSVEIATLRARGFQAVPVVVSVLVEATVLALAGVSWAPPSCSQFSTAIPHRRSTRPQAPSWPLRSGRRRSRYGTVSGGTSQSASDHQRIAERIIKALKEGTASSTRAVSPMCGDPRSTPLRLRELQTTRDAPVERIASRGLSSHPGSASDPAR